MFDFIKRMFHGKSKQAAVSHDPADLDVVESNDIEILKTSDYSEGAPAAAIDMLIAEQEMPPAELDLPMAELDEPTNEPDLVEEVAPADNYLLGDLKAARKLRDMQTRKAGMSYWSDGMMKYRPRSQRTAVDGTNAKQFNYFEVLRDEPMLRQIELQRPGMSIDQLNLNKYVHNSLKGKMVNDFVMRSMRLIRDQHENGTPTLLMQGPTADAAGIRDEGNRTLRDMFNAYEGQRRTESDLLTQSQAMVDAFDEQNTEISDSIMQQIIDQTFDAYEADENKESYTRWLMTVAEEATADEDILRLLMEDGNPDVRFCLAENYNIAPDMLKTLSEDDNPYVAHRAQKTLMRMQSTAGKVVDRDFGSGDTNRFRKSG